MCRGGLVDSFMERGEEEVQFVFPSILGEMGKVKLSSAC